MDIFVKIFEHKKRGLKKMQTARSLGIDVKTVRKYWDMTERDYTDYMSECKERYRSMARYDRFILDKLMQFPDVSSAQIYDWLRESYNEFAPAYSTVRLHVRRLREREGIAKTTKIRQYQAVEDLPFGQQAQADMGTVWLNDNYRKRVKLYMFCMSMSASRYKFVHFQRQPFNADDFVKAHDLAFKFFGGRTKEIVYDQDRVMCVSENAGNVILTDTFRAYQIYCGFSVYLCRPYDPETKGKIEAVIKYVKYNFLLNRVFNGIDTLNSQVIEWLDRTGNGLIHNTTKLVPKLIFAEEKKCLVFAPSILDEPAQTTYLVRKENVISYKSNRYAVPLGTYAPGKHVVVKEEGDSIVITDMGGKTIITHPLCRERGKLIRITHPERATYTKYKKLFDEVLAAFGNTEQTEIYLKKNWELYPRYTRDQFFIFRKAAQSYKPSEINRALEYCSTRELFNATDFRDTLIYFQNLEPPKTNEEPALPAKYAVVTAIERDISAYTKIYGGIIIK